MEQSNKQYVTHEAAKRKKTAQEFMRRLIGIYVAQAEKADSKAHAQYYHLLIDSLQHLLHITTVLPTRAWCDTDYEIELLVHEQDMATLMQEVVGATNDTQDI